jgi:hypothetical protein
MTTIFACDGLAVCSGCVGAERLERCAAPSGFHHPDGKRVAGFLFSAKYHS